MAYSCSDFTDDVLNTLISVGLIDRDAIADNDPQAQAEVAVRAIADVARKSADGARVQGADLFFEELYSSRSKLQGLADEQGARTLMCILLVQNAVLSNCPVELDAEDIPVINFVCALPSGDRWRTFVLMPK